MSNDSQCPKCNGENIYEDGNLWVCPECGHEWSSSQSASQNVAESTSDDSSIKDAHGNILSQGDTVISTQNLMAGKMKIQMPVILYTNSKSNFQMKILILKRNS